MSNATATATAVLSSKFLASEIRAALWAVNSSLAALMSTHPTAGGPNALPRAFGKGAESGKCRTACEAFNKCLVRLGHSEIAPPLLSRAAILGAFGIGLGEPELVAARTALWTAIHERRDIVAAQRTAAKEAAKAAPSPTVATVVAVPSLVGGVATPPAVVVTPPAPVTPTLVTPPAPVVTPPAPAPAPAPAVDPEVAAIRAQLAALMAALDAKLAPPAAAAVAAAAAVTAAAPRKRGRPAGSKNRPKTQVA